MSEKQIIFIGAGSYFTDSMLFFKERGFDLICIKIKETLSWFNNYDLLKSIGFKIIEDDDFLEKIKLTPQTLIFRGTYSGDSEHFPAELIRATEQEMDIFYKLTEYSHKNNCGAKGVLCFCGDNVYKTKQYIDWFAEKSKYADICLFDNDLIQKYIETNIPSLANKKNFIAYFETPLLRYVHHNRCLRAKKTSFISLGRNICSFDITNVLPILTFPLQTPLAKNKTQNFVNKLKYRTLKNSIGKTKFFMAAGVKNKKLKNDRILFFKVYRKYAFGLSHMYNLLDIDINDILKDKNIFEYDKQKYIVVKDFKSIYGKFMLPWIYTLDNTASKDVTYLMQGIIPIIPHTEHSFYKMLYDKKMAILVRSVEDLKNLCFMKKKEIQKYRNNIYKNRKMFTFESVGEKLLSLLED